MKKRIPKAVSLSLVILMTAGALIGLAKAYVGGDIDYATDEKLFEVAKQSNTVTYMSYNDAGKLDIICKESSGPAKSWVPLSEVSHWIKDGFISAEDRRFYKHRGIDVKRTAAAAFNSLFKYTSGFGASTITQQVIKNISGDNEKTLRRKLTEALRSIHLEMAHTKEEILEAYINVVPMAGNIYGVKEASLAYFGKDPSSLTLAEAATIVGITNAPSRYDPWRHPEACLQKRNKVLYAMRDNGVISENEYRSASDAPLDTANSFNNDNQVVSWFVETAREDALKSISEKYGVSRVGALMILNSGTKVLLTVNQAVQCILEKFFANTENLSHEVDNGLQYAMTVCDCVSGDIVGIVGAAGQKAGNRLINHATLPHPPASALKPLALYGPLIDSGSINWSTIFSDTPTVSQHRDGAIYQYPKNSPDFYEGDVTVYKALINSKNTVAIQMYNLLGPETIYGFLHDELGFSGIIKKRVESDGRVVSDLAAAPLALGQLTDGVSLRELTHAYTAFPSGGILRGGRTFYGILGADDSVLLENRTNDRRVFSERTAGIMNMMLCGVAEEGTAKSLTLKEVVDTAAKTGTSGGNLDKLLVGYTPRYTAGIWCGYSDRNQGVYSQSPNHIAIWDQVMRALHDRIDGSINVSAADRLSTFGAKMLLYCSKSGCLATDACAFDGCAEFGFYNADSIPDSYCPIHCRDE